MNRNDYKIAFAIGAVSGVLWFFVLRHLSVLSNGWGFSIVLALPLAFMVIVTAAHTFFRGPIFHKLAKFAIVGVQNSGVDFFVFNALIAFTHIEVGFAITLFKSASFICAMLNSYALNRGWTFDNEATPSMNRTEFARFAAVTIVGFLLNVGATTLVINAIHPLFGLTQVKWDNVAAIFATLLNLIWNFIGYKIFVFHGKGGTIKANTNAS